MGKHWISSMLLLMLCVWSAGCGRVHAPAGTDSSTHFLELCSSDDGCGGLSCVCGTCSLRCADDAACSGLAPRAVCHSGAQLACGEHASVCVAECRRDSDCAGASSSAHCRAGACQVDPPPPPVLDAGAIVPDSGSQTSGATADLGAVAAADAQTDAGSAACASNPPPTCNDPAGCDWAAQQAQYRSCGSGATAFGTPYLVSCGPYNAVVGTNITYYDATTGQPAGEEVILPNPNRPLQWSCLSYDPAFAAWYATVPMHGSGLMWQNSECAPPQGDCGTCSSLQWAQLPYPATWDKALAMAPCTAVRCGNYDMVTLPLNSSAPDQPVGVYYDANTGMLAGSIDRFGQDTCMSYAPPSEPYFVPPTEACVPYTSSECPPPNGP